LDLLPYATGNSILVRFRGINGAGTNLYLDNIGIYSASDPTGIEDLDMQASVFPNPASSQVCVQVNKSNTSVAVQLIDLQGRLIQTSSIAKGTKQTFLDLNQLSKGVYLIRLQSGDNVDIKRLVIQ
jgi:hypothetical protein